MRLYFYNESYKNIIENYELTEDQLRFTKHPKECLELAKEDSDRYSILAMEDDTLVNFFVLHENEGVKPYTTNRNSILLRAFSTDNRHQGQGYAKKVLNLLPEFVEEHFSEKDEIVLAVNIQNKVAQRLYEKCGFVDEGVRTMGPKGELIIMSYYLS